MCYVVHPSFDIGVLLVAIFAFHSAISLDLSRRENDRKVLAVKLQMQNMMCTMFQYVRLSVNLSSWWWHSCWTRLRKLKHAHVQERDRKREITRLQQLVKAIADDVKKCGSDLNYYVDRKLVCKYLPYISGNLLWPVLIAKLINAKNMNDDSLAISKHSFFAALSFKIQNLLTRRLESIQQMLLYRMSVRSSIPWIISSR